MRIEYTRNIAFQRRLTKSEGKEVNKLHPYIQNLAGHNGKNILILHDPCLPVEAELDTGIGYLFSKTGLKFLKEMKTLLGINTVEVHPQGEYYIGKKNRFCCPYSATALSLGSHLIPPAELVKPEYGKLLTLKEVQSIVEKNTAPDKNKLLNWENILHFDTQNEKMLMKAFERFKNLPDGSILKKEFTEFSKNNNDWLEPFALYQQLLIKNKKTLKHWNTLEQNLYNPDFDSDKRNKLLSELRIKYSNQISFYKFKEYFAEKFLKEARAALKNMGLTLTGDQLIGFSESELFAFPKAFMKDKTIGWGLPALDYDTILDPNSPASKLLERKTELFAKRYDGNIRFDVAWAYLHPAITEHTTGQVEHRALYTDALLKRIEETVKKVMGDNYTPQNLIYEFEADGKDFPLNKYNKTYIQNRTKVYSMQYMSHDWGYTAGFVNYQNFAKESLIAGLGNQDVLPLKNFANIKNIDFSKLSKDESINILSQTFGGDINILKSDENSYKFHIEKYIDLWNKKKIQAEILSKKYNIPYETLLNNPSEFARAKAAESFAGKNSMFYFMDVLGRTNVFDAQDLNGYENYRYRIGANYIEEYTQAVSKGFGINMFDIYEKRFVSLGLDTRYPELFKKIQKFKQIIMEPEPQKSNIKKYLAIGCGIILFAGLCIAGIVYNKKQPPDKTTAVNKVK